MPKFKVRVIFNCPIWAYTEIETLSEDVEELSAMNEQDLEGLDWQLDFDDRDPTPGDPEMDEVYFEFLNPEGQWEAI